MTLTHNGIRRLRRLRTLPIADCQVPIADLPIGIANSVFEEENARYHLAIGNQQSAIGNVPNLRNLSIGKKPRRVGGPPGLKAKGAFIRPQHTREMSKPNVLGVAGGNTHALTDRSPFTALPQPSPKVGRQHAGEQPSEASTGPGRFRLKQPPVMNTWAEIVMDAC